MACSTTGKDIWDIISIPSFALFLIQEVFINWNYDAYEMKHEQKYRKTNSGFLLLLRASVTTLIDAIINAREGDHQDSLDGILIFFLFSILAMILDVAEDYYKRFNPNIPKTSLIESYCESILTSYILISLVYYVSRCAQKFEKYLLLWIIDLVLEAVLVLSILMTAKSDDLNQLRANFRLSPFIGILSFGITGVQFSQNDRVEFIDAFTSLTGDLIVVTILVR